MAAKATWQLTHPMARDKPGTKESPQCLPRDCLQLNSVFFCVVTKFFLMKKH